MKRIPLTQGKYALVDDSDYEWLNQYKWFAHKEYNTWYAVRSVSRNGIHTIIRMHRVIMGLNPGDPRHVDHRNHNGLDNRQDKLRICTNSQNRCNQIPQKNRSSQFKGVCWHKDNHKWQTQIQIDGHNIYLGIFDSEIEAAKAYDRKAIELFGEYACINFPEPTKHFAVVGSIHEGESCQDAN